MDAAFALSDLLALQLHVFADDVSEVVDRALKEDKMEQALERLDNTWASVEFAFEPHRDTEVRLLKMREEDFETLEDNQLVVQARVRLG
jgi:dynein heavy chain